jgi:hypothetical protein
MTILWIITRVLTSTELALEPARFTIFPTTGIATCFGHHVYI